MSNYVNKRFLNVYLTSVDTSANSVFPTLSSMHALWRVGNTRNVRRQTMQGAGHPCPDMKGIDIGVLMNKHICRKIRFLINQLALDKILCVSLEMRG